MAGRRIEAMSSDEEDEGNGNNAKIEEDDAASVSSSSSSSSSCSSSSSRSSDGAVNLMDIGEVEVEALEDEEEGVMLEEGVNEEEALALVAGALETLTAPPFPPSNKHKFDHHPATMQKRQHPTYEAYTACVETLRGVAHSLAGKPVCADVITNLRATREAFSAAFALPAEAWLEWIRDEATLPGAGGGKEGRRVLEEKALVDVPASVTLRLVHLALIMDEEKEGGDEGEKTQREGGKEGRVRKACEEAVRWGGLHVLEGHKVWEAYRGFEVGLLSKIRAAAAAAADDVGTEERQGREEEARDRVIALFERQAAVPLVEGCKTLVGEWEAFEAGEREEIEKRQKIRNKSTATAITITMDSSGRTSDAFNVGAEEEEGKERSLLLLTSARKRITSLLSGSTRRLERILLPIEKALSLHGLQGSGGEGGGKGGKKKHERVGLWEAYIGVEIEREEREMEGGRDGGHGGAEGGSVARARAQQVCERAVTDCYFAPSLWEAYLDLLSLPPPRPLSLHPSSSSSPPDYSAALAVAKRAMKNAPAAAGVWCRYLRLLEATGAAAAAAGGGTAAAASAAAAAAAVDAAAQEALEGPLEGRGEEGLQVLMAHIDIFRRRVWVVMKKGEGVREDGEEEGVAGLTTTTKKKGSEAPARASPASSLGQAIAAFHGSVDYAEGENLPPFLPPFLPSNHPPLLKKKGRLEPFLGSTSLLPFLLFLYSPPSSLPPSLSASSSL